MFTGSERRGTGFEIQGNQDDDEGLVGFLAAGDLHLRRAGIHVRWRNHGEIRRGGGEHETGLIVEGDAVGVGDAAKAVAANFDAIAKGGDTRNERNFQGSRGRFSGRENSAGEAAGASLNGSENLLRVERSDEEGAAG